MTHSRLSSAREAGRDVPTDVAEALSTNGGCHGARHVAIIMDGNGRWAKKRGLPRSLGHKKGVEAVRKTARAAREIGLEALTLYAFSSENWRRPQEEISDLMNLLRQFIARHLEEFVRENIRLKVIGDYRALPADVVALVEDAMRQTAANDGPILAVGLNYGAQDELVRAVRSITARAAAGELAPWDIDAATIERALDTSDMPPLDLLIRTSGEKRLSNFLLWQAAYAELYFTDTLWPDFGAAELRAALADFGKRQRRFGGR